MGSVLVVVGHEHLENARKVLLAHNQHPVQTFRAGCAHKTLGHAVGLRDAKRCADDLDPVASKHLVKSVGEFLVPIANQETDVFGAIPQGPRHLPGVLRHPRRARIRRASGQMHPAAAQLDEEQHLEPLQPDRLHRKEIDGQHGAPVCPDKLAPGYPPASASGSESS